MNGGANYIQHLNNLLNPKNEDEVDDDDVRKFIYLVYFNLFLPEF